MPTICQSCGKTIEGISSGISLSTCKDCKKENEALKKIYSKKR